MTEQNKNVRRAIGKPFKQTGCIIQSFMILPLTFLLQQIGILIREVNRTANGLTSEGNLPRRIASYSQG